MAIDKKTLDVPPGALKSGNSFEGINWCCSQQRDYAKKTHKIRMFVIEDVEHQCFFCQRPINFQAKVQPNNLIH